LHTLREAVLRETHPALRQDVGRLQQAAYGVALLELATETETPLPELYELFGDWLAFLNRHAALRHGLLAFEIRFLHELGVAPSPGSGRALSAGLGHEGAKPGNDAPQLMEQLNSLDWAQLPLLQPDRESLRKVERRVVGILQEHLGRVPRSRSGALEATSVRTSGMANAPLEHPPAREAQEGDQGEN